MYPQPLFSVFGFEVYAYGVCMALGIAACFAFLIFAFKNKKFNDESIDKILIIGVVAIAVGLLSAMLFQSVYNYIADPSQGFKFGGGMTFYGGLIGGVVAFLAVWNLYIYVIAPKTRIKMLQNNMNAGLCDALVVIPIGILIAHAFGRLGCFFAGCCHGAETDAWYGIYMYASSLGRYATIVPTHLFECVFLFVLAGVIALMHYKFKFEPTLGVYAIAYGVWRFFLEYIRNDYRGDFVSGLTPSQFWSIFMVLAGIGYFFLYKYVLKGMMKHPELQPQKVAEEVEAQ